MTVQRMENVGIVVEDLDTVIEFITELGLGLEGRAPVAFNNRLQRTVAARPAVEPER